MKKKKAEMQIQLVYMDLYSVQYVFIVSYRVLIQEIAISEH